MQKFWVKALVLLVVHFLAPSSLNFAHKFLYIFPDVTSILVFIFIVINNCGRLKLFVILLALINDIVGHEVVGASALGYIFFFLVIKANRNALEAEDFYINWAGYVMAFTAMSLVRTGFYILSNFDIVIIYNTAIQIILSGLLFPIVVFCYFYLFGMKEGRYG